MTRLGHCGTVVLSPHGPTYRPALGQAGNDYCAEVLANLHL
jgi:hypothetical protein